MSPNQQRAGQPDWQRLAQDPDFEQLWESEPIERAITGSLNVLLNPAKTDPADIAYARGRLAVIFELSSLAERMAVHEVPNQETAPPRWKKRWVTRLAEYVRRIQSERGGVWPSPAPVTVSSLATQATPPSGDQ